MTWLYLTNNLIHDVTSLTNLIYLESLYLENNPIKDTSPLRILLAESPNVNIDIAVVGPGPVVEFSDVNLAKAVRTALKLYVGDEVDILKIPKPELAELKYLEYDLDYDTPMHLQISNLTGLEHATQLITLSLRRNNFSDITPLTQLTQLTELYLTDNQISNITPLTQLTQLTKLSLVDNEINDIAPLTQLTQLTELYLGDNEINDITPLAQLTQLTKLSLGTHRFGNNIVDITPLSQLTQLTELSLGDNNINDLIPLTQLTLLTELDLWGNDISDLTPLTQLTLLRELKLSNNNISDLTPLSKLIHLRRLELSFNLITDVTPLAQLRNLDFLFLIKNHINDITPLAQLPERTRIYASYNPVEFTGTPSDIAELPVTVSPPIETTSTTDAVVSISPASVASPAIGEQITLSLNIAGGEAVAGYQATVQFDGTALRYISSAIGDYLSAGAFSLPVNSSGNAVTLGGVSLAGESNGDGTLATITFEVIEVKDSTLTLSDVLLSDSAETVSRPQVEDGRIVEPPQLKEDVNGDGVVNILDLVRVASSLGKSGQNGADVNGDGIVNILDLVAVAGALGNTAAAPSAWYRDLEIAPTKSEVRQWLAQAQTLDLADATTKRGVLFLEHLLAALAPKETALLPNYPNPFNPETWIPYHLARDAEVRIAIYDINGAVMRILDLGYQQAGFYTDKGRAAYWDGRNHRGEAVGNGVYFYQLRVEDYAQTRRMLILK